MSLSSEHTVHAVPASSIQSNAPKSTITKRNAKPKKGLGAKKVGGLGAHKVTKVDFDALEKNAEAADRTQQRLGEPAETQMDEKQSAQSLRLAYQDINAKEKLDNVKLSKMDDRKKQQASRLGMGMGRTDDVSHSLSMVTINQENPKSSRKGRYKDKSDTFYDAYSSRPRRYKWDETDSDSDDDDNEKDNSFKFQYSKKGSSVDKEAEELTITPIVESHHTGASMFSVQATTTEPKNNRQRKSGHKPEGSNQGMLDKYSGATSLSSDMLFGSDRSQYESEQRLRSYEGRSSISSDDFYGKTSGQSQASHIPDVSDIKDGVKEGVRSVAGKLSSMATGIANSIQDRYG